jgi:GH35 family endo-1,4-beta-xylanase
VWYFSSQKNNNMILGVSFSPSYARYLGLDPTNTFKKIIDDWNFKYVRMSSQWNEVEKERGKFDFSELDYYMNEASKRGVKVVLAVGQKTPRWPECHVPDWVKSLSDEEYFKVLNNYIFQTANRYKSHKALEIWQVENEPFLSFGNGCRKLTRARYDQEIQSVKKIDPNHLTMTTDSGELSTWRKTAQTADLFGSTAYRMVWNKWLGYWSYDWFPAFFFRMRAVMWGKNLSNAFISELQTEPWMPDTSIKAENINEQFKSMDLERFEKHIDFARSTGFARAYLWGAEWWHWLEKNGHPEFADRAKQLNQ